MSETTAWSGSTWERVCRELFEGDEARMLAWGRRYLAAYPNVHGQPFHLGARFREIIGVRNRSQWWRSAVAMLAHRAGEEASQVAEPVIATSFGSPWETAAPALAAVPRPRIADAAERLRIFDLGTERQFRREKGVPAGEASGVAEPTAVEASRGWARQDLHE